MKVLFSPWNILFMGVVVALGFITGHKSLILPVLGAFELLLISVIGTRPVFRERVDSARERAAGNQNSSAYKHQKLLYSLPTRERQSFEKLKQLCLDLHNVSRHVKHDGVDSQGISSYHLDGINRLLWIYLKILYSKSALDQFFKNFNQKEIDDRIQLTQKRLDELGPGNEDTENESRLRKSLVDTLQTQEQRLKNYQLAKENYSFLEVEQDRLYTKIASMAEKGVGSQDPEVISNDIDIVSESVEKTEKTMRDLESLTGISFDDEETPRLIRPRVEA